MSNRIKTTARECDAFSRKSRGIIGWGRGQIKKLKRAYSKRLRQATRSAYLRNDDA